MTRDTGHLEYDLSIFPETGILDNFYFNVMDKTSDKNNLIQPNGHTMGIDSACKNEKNHHEKEIQH